MLRNNDIVGEIGKILCLHEYTQYIAVVSSNLACCVLLNATHITHLRDYQPMCMTDILHAARIGHLQCVKYVHACTSHIRTPPYLSPVCWAATYHGHVDCLQFAHENGYLWESSVCTSAARRGHLNCLQYAHENDCPWDVYTAAEATRHLPILKYVLANNCPRNAQVFYYALGYQQLESIHYAKDNGCVGYEQLAQFAGQLGVAAILFAHVNGLPFNTSTCANAIRATTFDVLAFAHSLGCPWNEWTCQQAALSGQTECLQYALANGCPGYTTKMES